MKQYVYHQLVNVNAFVRGSPIVAEFSKAIYAAVEQLQNMRANL